MEEEARKRLEALRKLLEELLADIQACKTGTVPTGATLGKMARRIKDPAYFVPPSLDAATYRMCKRRSKLLPYRVLWRRTLRYATYLAARCVKHPYATRQGIVLVHRLVMEHALGRVLAPDEVVHHRNGDHCDNRLVNLELISAAEHKAEVSLVRVQPRPQEEVRWRNSEVE